MQTMMRRVVAQALCNVLQALSYLKVLLYACSATHHHIPVALDLQQHCCDKLKPS
jgi:hypothetical protein